MREIRTPALLSIVLLGDVALVRDGQPLALPASKRTRALLGYLAATSRPHSRTALCDLLWEGPDDPRAALRWSLTKLRALVDDASATRLRADRERVAFDASATWIDLAHVSAALAAGTAQVSIDALEDTARLLQGEFLEGLDLPACWRFHHWCIGERDRCGQMRREVLRALVSRLGAEPPRALLHGRALVAADPLTESSHATLVRLLGAAGRYPDAEAHYEHARDLLRREIALADGGLLDESIRSLRRTVRAAGSSQPSVHDRGTQRGHAPADALPAALAALPAREALASSLAPRAAPDASAEARAASPPGVDRAPMVPALVGRRQELRVFAEALSAAHLQVGRLLLLLGTPGMGKTRLLDHLVADAVAAGWCVIRGRAFEAEIVRPYGLWLDALRGMGAPQPGTAADADPVGTAQRIIEHAARLLAGGATPAEASSRGELFDATASLLLTLARERPLLIVLDDLQWLEEGSASLLHYVVRHLAEQDPPPRVLLAAAARIGEIDDNTWAKGLMQSLTRERRLARMPLEPLDASDAQALLGAAAGADPGRVWRECGGNPLYLLAWARACGADADPESESVARSLDSLLADQIDSLDGPSADLLSWAAAIGRDFRPELLGAATGTTTADLMARLDRLERRGLLKATEDGHLDLAHDLLRRVAYRRLSQARRRLIHQRLALALADESDGQPQPYGEVAHHASLAGDALRAARASLLAGETCLRAFANAEAVAAAERGLAHAESLEQGAQRVQLMLALLKLRVVAAASPGARRLPSLLNQIQQAVDTAEALSLHAEAASGLHILSWLSQQSNDTERTRQATLQAERLTRRADEATRCQQLANTGRCLLEVESDMPRARALIAQAQALADSLELKVIELLWGQGLIARADGDIEAARAFVARAVAMAGLRDDHWREYECRNWLAVMDFERGAFDEVLQHGVSLVRIAQRMGDADAPFAQALCALVQMKRCVPDPAATAVAEAELSTRLQSLRAADDQAHLAYVLNAAAAYELEGGRHQRALAFALEALGAAQRIRRPSQIAPSLLTLLSVAAVAGDGARASQLRDELSRCATEHPSAASTAALARAEALLAGSA